jgi:hypothetical protein
VDSLGRLVSHLIGVVWDNASHSLLERTLDDSANRREVLPVLFLALDEMLSVMSKLTSGLSIDTAATARNLERYGVFAATERLLMELVKAGADRQKMHHVLRDHSMTAWDAIKEDHANPLVDNLSADPELTTYIPGERIRLLLNAADYVGDAPQRARSLAAEILAAVHHHKANYVNTTEDSQLIVHYKGTATLRNHPELKALQCTFDLFQLMDGKMELRCEVPLMESLDHSGIGPEVELLLNGFTDNGHPVNVKGPALQDSFSFTVKTGYHIPEPAVIHYTIQGMSAVQIGNPVWSGKTKLIFPLMNFEFLGTEAIEVEPRKQTLALLPLSVANTTVLIRKHKDYDSRIKHLHSYGGSAITCQAEIELESPDDLQDAQDIIDNVCRLLSIASGTVVMWPYFEVIDADGTWLCTFHRGSVIRNFVTWSLIDPRQLSDVKVFVESTYDRFVELQSTHRMIQVVHAFTETRANNFLEARALTVVSIVDYLVGICAKDLGEDALVPLATFEKGKDIYKDLVTKAVETAYPDLKKEIKEILVDRSQANWLSYRRGLKLFRKQYHVPISPDEIERFVKSRNSITHNASFVSEDITREYFSMVHLLDRMLLALLGYRGPYINCITWEREELFINAT